MGELTKREVDRRLCAVERRLDSIERNMATMASDIATIDATLVEMLEDQRAMMQALDRWGAHIEQRRANFLLTKPIIAWLPGQQLNLQSSS